ncbi:MAG: ABC transporter permease [Proteobacteria bacterium]|nr:ABC transporter permease [Pseudomonadota bacterium]
MALALPPDLKTRTPLRGPWRCVFNLFIGRRFVYLTTRQRLVRRYSSTLLGYGWLIVQPLIFLIAIGVIRVAVFEKSWPAPTGGSATDAEFLAALFMGLVIFWSVSEPLSRSPSLLLEFRGIIKNEPLPLDTLVGVVYFENLIQTFLRFIMLLVGYTAAMGLPSVHAFALPLIILPLFIGGMGLAWIFSRIGLYHRDLEQILPPVFSALFFVSAVFFPLSSIDEPARSIFALNPIAFTIDSARNALLWHQWPDWEALGILTLLSALLMWLGWLLFDDRRGKYVDAL